MLSSISTTAGMGFRIKPTPTTGINTGLLMHYKFESGDMGTNTVKNYATNGTSVTVGNPQLNTSTFKVGSSSLTFVKNSTYIVPPAINFGLTTGHSLAFWMKTPANESFAHMFVFEPGSSPANVGIMLRIISGAIEEYVNGVGYANLTSVTNDGNWHHVVWMFGNTSSRKLYVDNVLRTTYTTTAFSSNCISGGSTRIGSCGFASPYDYGGQMDDIRLYNRTISESEIAELYALT